MKLHLGCGNRYWNGYVNVDIGGVIADELYDVTDAMPPEWKGKAEEIHAIHVFEHVWRTRALRTLQYWFSILKEDGLIVLEMPCLDSILTLFSRRAGVNMTLWGLYGDPNTHADPEDLHKWCYSRAEIMSLMLEAGFIDVRIGKAQFHQPARDMRVTGRRPFNAP